jgi:hypothetical protein
MPERHHRGRCQTHILTLKHSPKTVQEMPSNCSKDSSCSSSLGLALLDVGSCTYRIRGSKSDMSKFIPFLPSWSRVLLLMHKIKSVSALWRKKGGPTLLITFTHVITTITSLLEVAYFTPPPKKGVFFKCSQRMFTPAGQLQTVPQYVKRLTGFGIQYCLSLPSRGNHS